MREIELAKRHGQRAVSLFVCMLNYEYAMRKEGYIPEPGKVEPLTLTVQAMSEDQARIKVRSVMSSNVRFYGFIPVKVREFRIGDSHG